MGGEIRGAVVLQFFTSRVLGSSFSVFLLFGVFACFCWGGGGCKKGDPGCVGCFLRGSEPEKLLYPSITLGLMVE